MPIYEYKCTNCGKISEEIRTFREQRGICPCCNGISKRLNKCYHTNIKMGGFNQVDRAQIEKARKHGDVDEGIPFGEVPGDDAYIDARGNKPGDKDYFGPLP